MSKQREREPENEAPPADGPQGPRLVIQFENDDRQKMFTKADEGFGPFVFVSYQDPDTTLFKVVKRGVSPWMLTVLNRYWQVELDLAIGSYVQGQVGDDKPRILTPGGRKVPQDLKGPGTRH